MKLPPRLVVGLLLLAVVASACRSESPGEEKNAAASPLDPAVTLRVRIEGLMRELVYETGATSEALITVNKKAYGPAGNTLDATAVELAKELAGLFPVGEVEKRGLEAFRSIGGTVLAYASATRPLVSRPTRTKAEKAAAEKAAARHQAGIDNAIAEMRKAAREFGNYVNEITPVLLGARVAGELGKVFGSLRVVVDLQRKKDFNGAIGALRTAAGQIGELATMMAGAVADELPAQFPGDVQGPPAGVRSSLDAGLREHVFLLTLASQDQQTAFAAGFNAAKGALDQSSTALAQLLGSFYGPDVEKAFLPLWQRHVELLVTYLTSTKDRAKQDKAVQDLAQYAKDVGTFLAGANAELKGPAITTFFQGHVNELKAIIDNQIAGKFEEAGTAARAAMAHMDELGSLLADATVKKFPKKFVV